MLRTILEVTVVVLKVGALVTPFLERWARGMPKNTPKLPG